MALELFKKTKVTVTSINLKWRGATHSINGMKIAKRLFEIKIPFQNKPEEDYNLDFLKKQKKPAATVNKIDVKEPFKLVSIAPELPAKIEESEKIEFKAMIEAPDYGYEGPLNVELITDNSDLAHIEIPKVVVISQTNKLELKEKKRIMDIPKGQVFKQNIHLFGVVEFGTEIKKITVASPFTFVSSDPMIPFKVDRKTGYLIDIYIQAPQQNYGGDLEIKIN